MLLKTRIDVIVMIVRISTNIKPVHLFRLPFLTIRLIRHTLTLSNSVVFFVLFFFAILWLLFKYGDKAERHIFIWG